MEKVSCLTVLLSPLKMFNIKVLILVHELKVKKNLINSTAI